MKQSFANASMRRLPSLDTAMEGKAYVGNLGEALGTRVKYGLALVRTPVMVSSVRPPVMLPAMRRAASAERVVSPIGKVP